MLFMQRHTSSCTFVQLQDRISSIVIGKNISIPKSIEVLVTLLQRWTCTVHVHVLLLIFTIILYA